MHPMGGMKKQGVVSVTRDTRENDVKQVSSDYFDVKTDFLSSIFLASTGLIYVQS